MILVCELCQRTATIDDERTAIVANANAAGFYCMRLSLERHGKTLTLTFHCKSHYGTLKRAVTAH